MHFSNYPAMPVYVPSDLWQFLATVSQPVSCAVPFPVCTALGRAVLVWRSWVRVSIIQLQYISRAQRPVIDTDFVYGAVKVTTWRTPIVPSDVQ